MLLLVALRPLYRPVRMALVAAMLAIASESHAAVRFVAQDATGAANGLSWTDAFLHPQDAVNVSGRGDQIWVKEGRYVGKRLAPQVLTLRQGVSVYGGFAGDEEALAHRDPVLHETILDGEHDVAHVVVTPGGGRLDGFTVTGGGLPAPGTAEGGGFSGDGATLALLLVYDNRAFYGGGAFGADLVVEDSRFENNYAAAGGGALYVSGATSVRRSAFVGNEAEEESGVYGGARGAGGAIYAGVGSFEVEDSSFDANVALTGGGILVNGFHDSTLLRVRRCGFTGNRSSAIQTGGALEATIEDSTFAANAALTRTLTFCAPDCSSVTFPARGGAIGATVPVTVRRSTFSANTSEVYGGGLAAAIASVVIDDSRFEDNTAIHGGAIHLDRAPFFVSDGVFRRNQAITGGGGAVALYPIEPPSSATHGTFERCRFDENVASGGGGALELFDGDTVVESNRFFGNQAQNGGAVYGSALSAVVEPRLELRNSVLAYNYASIFGGGLDLFGITCQIENDTIYGNASGSFGGGLFAASADITVRNTILWNDTAPVWPEVGIQQGSLTQLSIAYSDVQGGWPGTGNLDVDPGLRDPFLFDFHLTYPGSKLLVDAGTPGFSPVYDFDGELRPIDGNLDGDARVDIGADELADPCAGQLDHDLDGRCDVIDNCPYASNPSQVDTGGIGVGSPPDGIGDACQCGDVNGDGRVTLTDSVLITRSLLVPPTARLAQPDFCDVGGNNSCSLADAVIIRRALLAPPTATIEPRCTPAQP